MLVLAVTEAELAELVEAHERGFEGAPGSVTSGRLVGPGIVGEEDGWQRDRGAAWPGAVRDKGPARREARRSLQVRGLLEGDRLREPLTDDDAALVVRTVLDLRATSARGIVVDRLTVLPGAGEPQVEHLERHVHLHVEDDGRVGGACVEDVREGTHLLWLVVDPAEVAPAVAEVVVPEDAVAGRGTVTVPGGGTVTALVEALGRPRTLAQLAVVDRARAGGPVVRSALAGLGPSGCWAAEVEPQGGLPAGLVLEPVEPGWAQSWAGQEVEAGPGRASARTGSVPGQGTMAG